MPKYITHSKSEIRQAQLSGKQACKMGLTESENFYEHDSILYAEWRLAFFTELKNKKEYEEVILRNSKIRGSRSRKKYGL